MYTILMSQDKSLRCTHRETIYQREKLVDKLKIIVPETIGETNMNELNIILLKYTDQGNVAHSEMLVADETPYKEGYLSFTFPVDTNITRFAGDITISLSFLYAALGPDSDEVMHSGETTITVNPLRDIFVTDDSLQSLDKRMLELQKGIDAVNTIAEDLSASKADDISYEDNTLQLLSNGKKIGTSHVLDQQSEFDVVDFDESSNPDNPDSDEETFIEF